MHLRPQFDLDGNSYLGDYGPVTEQSYLAFVE